MWQRIRSLGWAAFDPSVPDPVTGTCIMSRRMMWAVFGLGTVGFLASARAHAQEVKQGTMDPSIATSRTIAITALMGAVAPIVLGLGKLFLMAFKTLVEYRLKAKQIDQNTVVVAGTGGQVAALVDLLNAAAKSGYARPIPRRPALIVEDDATPAALLGKLLLLRGYVAEWAASVTVAEEKIAASYYDMLVLDLNLAGERSDHLAEAMRLRNPACRVFVVTGRPDDPAIAKLAPFIEGVIGKPIDVDDFEDRIKLIRGK